jgi:hypothetical protein
VPQVPAKPRRLRAGELRGQVEDFLNAHAGGEFGPVPIGRALGRSIGAVANALERLVDDGYAVRTSTSPLRYRASND